MVQGKVPNPNKLKLGIQADHIKSEKPLGSLKPSSYQYRDGRNKGTDLKKKMKKSRSIKLSDIQGLRSSPVPVIKTINPPPAKPPPLNVPAAAAAATPQKKYVIKAMDGSPNYLKSTSSSEAKKEIYPVSSRNPQTGSDGKNLRRRSSTGSKISSGFCNKPARTLTRTSSLKLVRTLTKSPSFKPARASAKKCSRVVLCADMDVQRPTCSSTLKDSKFPAYLMLNPGGTESEGTSVLKVCPYTYCSLNGHHHTPLPPLKCFLKARRRSLKTQRSMKMEALSPRRLNPSGDETEEFDAEQLVFGSKPASNGVDLDNSPISPFKQERSVHFFIEIYAKSKGNDSEADRGSGEMNSRGMDDSKCGNETAPEHDMEKPISESLSEGSPHCEIDFDENLEHFNEIISKVDTKEALREDLKHKDADEEYEGNLVKEEPSPWNFHDGDEQECFSSIVVDHSMFEVIDMEWEEWKIYTSEPDDETHSSVETDDQSDMNIGDSSESDGNNLHADESHGNLAEETLTAGVEQEVFEEDVACIDTCSQVSETICYYQASSAEEMFQMLVDMDEEEEEETAEIYSMGIVTNPSSTEELHEGPGPISGKENSLEDGTPITSNDVPENGCITDVKDESMESTKQFQLHSSDKLEQDETNEDYNVILMPSESEADPTVAISDSCPEKELQSGVHRDSMEARGVADAESMIEVNCAIDGCFPTQAIAIGEESLFAESQDHQSDSQHEKTNVVQNQSIKEEDQDEAVFKAPTCMDSESEEQSFSMMRKTSLAAQGNEEIGEMEMEMEDNTTSIVLDVAEILVEKSDKTSREGRRTFSRSNAKEELADDHNNRKWTIGRRRHEENNDEEPRKFNPREPNLLPVVPEPDAEKVDLRHQMMDERKNAEEWMLDHALQQAVSKLAPARKRKVALLVEAFETVLPINTCETRLRHTSTGFAHGRPIQACN